MSKLRAIYNHVVFQFEDELATSKGVKQFKSETNWGFEIRADFDHATKAPRWGIVVAVGPHVCDDIKEGMRILIEPLKWTEGVEHEGVSYWRTDDEHVLAVDDEYNASVGV